MAAPTHTLRQIEGGAASGSPRRAQVLRSASDVFPFCAIVGQDELKRVLCLAAIDGRLGGVLAFGDRGTGKSTIVRALARLLPPIETVAGCAYNCRPEVQAGLCAACLGGAEAEPVAVPAPVVDLPLGATEDRVVGTLDLERALSTGEKRFEPGLLARAHRGYLYVDEVNLLEDHLVDLLLDVAASGESVVEREGLSVRHPARFVLIGSGNPEEGELRPQLLDRFGLCIDVVTPTDVEERVEIVRRRDAFDRDPAAFAARWAGEEAALRQRIVAARDRLESVEVDDAVLGQAVRLCTALGSDGLRGELTLMRAARALAALDGASAVEPQFVAAVAPAALRHRLRRDPLDESDPAARIERAIAETF